MTGRIYIVLLVLLSSMTAKSQVVYDKVYHLKDGTLITVPLADIVEQTHSTSSTLILDLTNGTQISILKSDLDYYNYVKRVNSNINRVATAQPTFQIYPNPTRDMVNLAYALKETTDLSIGLFNVNGQEVVRWEDGEQPEGEYVKSLDLSVYPAGVYFLRMEGAAFSRSLKVIITK